MIRIIRKMGLLAVPALALVALALPASASTNVSRSPASPADIAGVQLCANGGAGLCLQSNGIVGSLIANDNSNHGSGGTQLIDLFGGGVTEHSSGSFIGYPFNSSVLNKMIAPGRPVFDYLSEATLNDDLLTDCITVNEFIMRVGNTCAGSSSSYVASGSGRMISVGASNLDGAPEFVNSSGHNSGNPVSNASMNCGVASCRRHTHELPAVRGAATMTVQPSRQEVCSVTSGSPSR